MNSELRKLLEGVSDGSISVDDAVLKLKKKPFEDIGFAKVDMHRKVRQGAAEVIYGAGKTAKQIIGIISVMKENGQKTILVTRIGKEAAEEIQAVHPLSYYEEGRCAVIGKFPKPDGIGKIVIATGGTSDIPVAEEAAITAEAV